MAGLQATLKQLIDGFDVPAGSPQNVTVAPTPGRVVEMEDLHFHLDSAVVLPEPRNEADTSSAARDRVTGLAVIATCWLHAKGNSRDRLLIAGHTDTSGTGAHNLALSRDRADNVAFLVAGRKADWAALSERRHKIEDVQAILKWIDRDLFPGMDPGEVDGEDGPLTQGALKAFQERYNAEFGKAVPVDGKAALPTWEAFFDAYMLGLKQILETDDNGLANLRAGVKLLESLGGAVGCGENHPIDAPRRDGFRSRANRRVELLFFDPSEGAPRRLCHPDKETCKPEKCDIYRLGLFDIVPLPVNPGAMKGKTITLSTTASAGEKIELLITDRAERILRTLEPSAFEASSSLREFSFDPDALPGRVDLFFRRDGEIRDIALDIEPAALRDSLRDRRFADAVALAAGEPAPTDGAVAGPGAAPAGTAGTAQTLTPNTDLRFTVRFENPRHRLLEKLALTLSDTIPVPTESRPGFQVFDLPAGQEALTLRAVIPDVLDMTQEYTVIRQAGRPATLVEKNSRHPRIQATAWTVTGKIIDIRIDFGFLDVTRELRPLYPSLRSFLDTPSNLSGCSVAVLEHTAAPPGTPSTWTVAMPPQLDQTRLEADLLIFLQNEVKQRMQGLTEVDGAYTDSTNVSLRRLTFFWEGQPVEGSYIQNGIYIPFANPGFLKQLAQAGKQAILVMPFPVFEAYGVMDRPGLPALKALQQLLIALHAEKHARRERLGGLVLNRIAVAAFSSGTPQLVNWCQGTVAPKNTAGKDVPNTEAFARHALSKAVREVYFMDGRADTKGPLNASGPVAAWFRDPGQGDDPRRLRLIGTANTEVESVALAKALGNPKALDIQLAGDPDPKERVSAFPGRQDYWYDNADYLRAITDRRPNAPRSALKKQGTPLEVEKDASDVSNIFVTESSTKNPPGGAFLRLMSPAAPNRAPVLVRHQAQSEAACFILFEVLKGNGITAGGPIATDQDFAKAMDIIINSGVAEEKERIFKHRHPWSVFGGAGGFKGRQGFTGYLQICLETSGFA